MSEDGSSYTPGGDFYWLGKTFTWTVNFKVYRSSGDDHGHNISGMDYGLMPDLEHSSAPGGVYPSSALGCNSCHNPHGRTTDSADSGSAGEIPPSGTEWGNYRLLGGTDYNAGSHASGFRFVNPAPVAMASSDDWIETDDNHVAYGSGMSEWCGNCHPGSLDGEYAHVSGNNVNFSSSIVANYNGYVSMGDATGTKANSYLSLVPFELGTTNASLLNPSSTSGPDGASANIMCLTCHRTHASAFQNILRWDYQATFIADSHPKSGDSGATGIDILNSYYGRDMIAEFGSLQRQFCNKCHLQD
jgi:predicted CXXCH cytochrome family protein